MSQEYSNRIYSISLCGIAICLLLSLTSNTGAQILHQMVVEDVLEGEYPAYLVRNPDEAVLIVHSLIDNLSFETNNGSIQQEHPSPGEYILHLRPGTHIMRFKVEGFSVVQKRIVIDKKSYREVKVSPAGQFGERVDFGTVEFTLNPGPVIVIQDGVQSGEFTVDASGIFRLQLSLGKHNIKLVRLGSGTYESKFDMEAGETYREEVSFSGSEVAEPIPSGSGILLVKSNPTDATVFVDGVVAGNTTLQVREIASGVHQIRIEKLLHKPIVKQVEITANSLTTLEEELAPDYSSVNITTAPSAAEVMLDGKLVGKTPYRNEAVSSGQHSVLLRKSYFHDKSLDLSIKAGIDVDTLISLIPAFGSLRVVSKPDGAVVYLDNNQVGATPLTLDTLSSGQYVLRVQKKRYGTIERTITVSDGKQTLIDTPLDEDFGVLLVNSNPQGIDVRVDGVESVEGSTPFRRNLKPGLYTVTFTDDKYETYIESVNLRLKDTVIVAVDSLIRKTGVLKIFTSPIEAELFIDGNSVGKSPLVSTYPTGSYDIRAKLAGYVPTSQTAVVSHNSTMEMDLTLTTGGSLEIAVQPSNATIYVDGERISGKVIHSLVAGKHTVKATADRYQDSTIEVNVENGKTQRADLYLKPVGGTISVVSSSRRSSLPNGTVVKIDGKLISGYKADDVEPGTHTIAISAPGHNTKKVTVEVSGGQTKEVKVSLSKVKTGPGGFAGARQFLNGGTLYLGYQQLQFDNDSYKTNTDQGLIEEKAGFTGGYRGFWVPLLIDLSAFYQPYKMTDVGGGNVSVVHLGVGLSILLDLLPVNKIIVPCAGGGYQLSQLSADLDNAKFNTSALFWTAGGYINIPIRSDRKQMLNRFVFGAKYKKSIAAGDRAWSQLEFCIGIGGPMFDKD